MHILLPQTGPVKCIQASPETGRLLRTGLYVLNCSQMSPSLCGELVLWYGGHGATLPSVYSSIAYQKKIKYCMIENSRESGELQRFAKIFPWKLIKRKYATFTDICIFMKLGVDGITLPGASLVSPSLFALQEFISIIDNHITSYMWCKRSGY